MPNNRQYYYKVLDQLGQWLPEERITRLRNMALLIIGLHLSRSVHLGLIVRKWPLPGQEPSLVNRLHRFLVNPGWQVREWYEPIARQLIQAVAGRQIRLVIDCTKLGFNYRLMTIGLAYKKRVLPLAWSVHQGRKGHTTVAAQLKLFSYVQSLAPKRARSGWSAIVASSRFTCCSGCGGKAGTLSSASKVGTKSDRAKTKPGSKSTSWPCSQARPGIWVGSIRKTRGWTVLADPALGPRRR